MADTIFVRINGAVSNGDATNPDTASMFITPPMTALHNVIRYRHETITLDRTDTRIICSTATFPAYATTQWVGFMARVVGEAKATTVGTNWDGTSIGGVTAGYGVETHPGFISMVTTKMTSLTLEGLADGTTVEYLLMILAQDDQL